GDGGGPDGGARDRATDDGARPAGDARDTPDAGKGRTGALAYTGTEDLGVVAAVAAVGLAAGATCWWLARRRAGRRTAEDEAGSTPR
ncbi:hypothetical protein Q7F20_12860, partial [Curtobacterium sp. A7_M15]|uniref:hypothetical protein n=1 Tax=Curtobacterium sp. A7_M15 TaxID=3065241 RepID=UPI002737B50C